MALLLRDPSAEKLDLTQALSPSEHRVLQHPFFWAQESTPALAAARLTKGFSAAQAKLTLIPSNMG